MSPEISVVAAADADGFGPVQGTDVVFLPTTIDGDTPVYPGATPQLINQLVAAGVTAGTWHPIAECEFVSDRGPITDALLQIGVGIASSAGWYALQSLLRGRTSKVRVVAVFERGDERLRAEMTGDAAEVASALEQLDPFKVR